MKKIIAMFTALALLSPIANDLHAANTYSYTGGNCYQECRTAPCLAPAIALGAIALAAIIAVAVQKSNNDHGHCD